MDDWVLFSTYARSYLLLVKDLDFVVPKERPNLFFNLRSICSSLVQKFPSTRHNQTAPITVQFRLPNSKSIIYQASLKETVAPVSDLLKYLAGTILSVVMIMPKPTTKNVESCVWRGTNDIETFLIKVAKNLAKESGMQPSACSWVFVQDGENLDDDPGDSDNEHYGLVVF